MSQQCPIWGTPCENVKAISFGDRRTSVQVYDLAHAVSSSPRAGGNYVITSNAANIIGMWAEKKNLLKAKLSRWIYEQNLLGALPEVTSQILKEVEHWPMPSVSRRMDYLLEFIDSKTERIDALIPWSDEMQAATLSIDEEELRRLIYHAEKSGRLEVPVKTAQGNSVVITLKGYEHLEELRAVQALSEQAFVAMWFDKEMKEAWEKGFKPGIEDAGYKPLRIDLKQHNNKIDDEIIAEIRRSQFLVADFTSEPEKARGGVYYEAGFAQGLNIPVIFTCRKDILDSDDIHFDTRQFNHIAWEEENLEDLRENLKNRIAATIGDGPYRNNQKPA